MAEQEVIKHTKKIYKIWGNKNHSFWDKVKEFLLEILIIVFAISLSMWFHNWSEHKHQQKDVEEFLFGLKEDLKSDIVEMQGDKDSYAKQRGAFNYISNLKLGESPAKDSLGFYYTWIFNSTGLNPNNGRFEGFKSSGKIGLIENKRLQNDIMDLYQENIPSLLLSTSLYVNRKNNLFQYLQHVLVRTSDSTTNFPIVINSEESHNICRTLAFTGEIQTRYDSTITKMRTIVATINKEYGLKD